MYVNVAVLRETQPHERRVALMPSVVPKLIKLGAKLYMQCGAGNAIQLPDSSIRMSRSSRSADAWLTTPTSFWPCNHRLSMWLTR